MKSVWKMHRFRKNSTWWKIHFSLPYTSFRDVRLDIQYHSLCNMPLQGIYLCTDEGVMTSCLKRRPWSTIKKSSLMSYDTLHQWHLLIIEQTKIIYYNFPDNTANFEKKLLQDFYYTFTIITIPAYPKILCWLQWLP